MSQLNEQDPSSIGDFFLTSDGTELGVPVRAVWKEADWSPIRRVARAAIGGAEVQEVDMGGASGTKNWLVSLEIEHCTDVAYAGLVAQRNAPHTTFPALLKLEATDGLGVKRQQAFTKLRWLDLSYKTAERFGSRIYSGVVASLVSEE